MFYWKYKINAEIYIATFIWILGGEELEINSDFYQIYFNICDLNTIIM
jgi:hypothetical protein